jgi:TolB protein
MRCNAVLGRVGTMRGLAGVAALVSAAMIVPPAQAAFPGHNGRIAFSAAPGDHPPLGWLRTMSPQGTDVQQLRVNTAREDSAPVWSPDGRRLAFTADSTFDYTDGSDSELVTSDAQGAALRRLTRTSGLEAAPAWSPDGRRLAVAVVTGLDTADPRSEIWTVEADGSARRRLSAPGARDHHPSWSPDGRRIAFASDRTGSREIYTMSAAGGDVRRLTFDADQDDQPTWSPDGRRIVWVGDVETFTGSELYSANASDGRNWVRLTRNAFPDGEPTYSPDGRWIAFTTQCRSGSCEDREVWRIKSDGTDPRFLADGMSPDWQRLAP